jgi:hypothetical protein
MDQTIILLLFGTTTLVRFRDPTGSMEDTLLIGDHLLWTLAFLAGVSNTFFRTRDQARRHYRLPVSMDVAKPM